MDEKITLYEYTTQSFMFYTFVRYTFLFYLKNKGKTVIEISKAKNDLIHTEHYLITVFSDGKIY